MKKAPVTYLLLALICFWGLPEKALGKNLPVGISLLASSLFAQAEIKTPKAWLGMAFEEVLPQDVPQPFQPVATGGLVKAVQVFKGSSAETGGLLVGDYILKVNGAPMNGRRTLLDTIQGKSTGSKITLEIGRDGVKKVLIFALSPRPEDMQELTKTMLGSEAPPLQGSYYHKPAGSLKELKGKVVIVDFWATWCGPCRMTLPSLQKLQENYRAKGLVVVGVSSETKPELEAFQKQSGQDYSLFQDPAQSTTRAYQAFAYPTVFLIDRKGLIQRIETGAHAYEDMERWVKELL